MSVIEERRTVSLWPVDESSATDGGQRPADAAVAQRTDKTDEPATQAISLAAIASSYHQGRAGIISGGPSPTPGQSGQRSPVDVVPALVSPGTPLPRPDEHEPAEGSDALPAGEDHETTTVWSRLWRRRRPAPRGRHAS